MATAPPTQGRPLNLLLVEDGPEYAVLVEEMLRDAFAGGANLTYRACAAHAEDTLRAGDVDCVLLDLTLPDASGLEALSQVQRVAPDVPIVVLSGQEREETAVEAVQEGAQDYLVKRHADAHSVARAIRYAMERKQSERELTHLALHDPLTGLANRALFTDRVDVALAHTERSGRLVAVMFLDLDRFKVVNDSLGHAGGDQLLREIARRLHDRVRPSDTIARFGGDEFMVLCDDLESETQAFLVAERLSGGFADPFQVGDREVFAGTSIGIAFGRDRAATSESLIIEADQAMYRAKQQGTRYEVFDRAAASAPVERLSLDTELHRALEREEFRLYYQPEVDLERNAVFAVEALLRWQHPDRGLLPAQEFVPAAEESGLIGPIGEWAIGEAARQLASWREAGLCAADTAVSVNLSIRQLADPDIVAIVESALADAGIPPETLLFEITESQVAADAEAATERLRDLGSLGVKLSLDDFGTGVSSLSALGNYPVDMLKIDRSFVAALGKSPGAERMLGAVVGVAHAAGLTAVAEGVERQEQLDGVLRTGCNAAQGFFIGEPDHADAVAPELLRWPFAEGVPA
jgi:diguanylate cyclase